MVKAAEEYRWQDLKIGSVIDEPGSARDYKTGDWRTQKPDWTETKCIRCGICWMYCPDAAVYRKDDGYFTADYDYCKGCGICGRECPTGAITMLEEER